MLTAIEGTIARRILLNFRADPAVVRRVVPEPFELDLVDGHAVVGVCLIRLEHERPRGLPEWVGFSSENMAHRFAVLTSHGGKRTPGVYISRRDTDSRFARLAGGRIFPGYHHGATFDVHDDGDALTLHVTTDDHAADIRLRGRASDAWPASRLFRDLADASQFFERGSCGYSCGRDGRTLEGLELRTMEWNVRPFAVDEVHAAYFEDAMPFPAGSIVFDHALIMRGLRHEWHSLREVPELATM